MRGDKEKILPLSVFNKNFNQTFLIFLSLLMLIHLLPFLLAGFYYRDDLPRIIKGSVWDSDGRYLIGLLFKLLSGFNKTLDIFPLPHLLGASVLGFSFFLFAKRFLSFLGPWVSALLCFLCFANPFFLQNLSFRYDSLMMQMAVALAFFAFVLSSYSSRKAILGVFLCILASLYFYQSGFLIYSNLLFLFFPLTFKDHPKPYRRFFILILIPVLAYIIDYITTKPFLSHSTLVQMTPLPAGTEGIKIAFKNFLTVSNEFILLFHDKELLLTLLLPFILSYLAFCRRAIKEKLPLLVCLFVFALPFILYIVAILQSIVYDTPNFTPRIFLGFFPLFLYSYLGITLFLWERKNFKMLFLLALPVLNFLSLGASYSNFTNREEAWQMRVIDGLASDLVSHNLSSKIHKIKFVGETPLSPQALFILERRPFFTLMPNNFLNDWNTFAALKYSPFFDIERENISYDYGAKPLDKEEEKNSHLISQTPVYTLRVSGGDKALVIYSKTSF